MAFGSDRSANFVIAAKDAATGPIGDIGKAMGRLKSSAGAAFKAVAAGAAVAATALAGFVVASVKGAIEDERSTILTNAALKARGFELDKIGPKIEEQIKAMQRLGFTDDDVRGGLEVGSRFFKNQENLLKANATAANIAAATGSSLSEAMMAIGKASNGSTKGLKNLGIEVEKGATLKDILRAADEKYLGIAEELADSTSGKMLAAQIAFGEQMDALGARFIPAVTDALGFLATNVLPVTEELMTKLGDVIFDAGAKLTEKGGFVDSVLAVVGPIGEKLQPKIQELADTVGKLFDAVFKLVGALWDDGKGPLAIAVTSIAGFFTDILLPAIKLVLDIVTLVVNTVTEALKLLDRLSAKQPGMSAGAAAAAGSTVYGLGTGVGGGAGGSGTSAYPTGPIGANIVIGTQATSSLDLYLGSQSTISTGRTVPGRP